MGKRKRIWHRLTAMLLAGMMCMTMLPVSAFADGAESVPTALETAAVDSSAPPTESESASSGDSAPLAESDPAAESSAGVSPATPESGSVQEPEEPPLSKAAQNFVAAVEALDRESILAAINDWAQASQAWQAEKENPELAAALEAATVSSDEAAALVYAAEDLYNMLPDDERDDSAVQAAYAALVSLIVAMQVATENPQTPEDTGAPPDLAKIAQVLYGDLPDAPTGSYMGSYGLPVATGETKIGIGAWHDELLLAENAGHLDAKTLNADSVTISVPRKAGQKYAVVALNAQVEYPANGSTSEIVLPEDVVLLGYDETPASQEDAEKILNATYTETSAATTGIYVRAENDFTATLRYCAPDGTALEKNVNVHLSDAVAVRAETTGASTYEARPTPSVTTGRITAVRKVNGSWLIWFNGEPAYCCTHGAQGQPNGCPLYTYAYTSIVTADQYTPGDHYGNQVGIWGGLGQLSLGLMSADAAPDAAYDDTQRWVMEHYPDSVAAKAYLSAVEQIADGATTFAADSDYYVYIYQPGISGWQTVTTPGPPTGGKDPDIPPATPEYYASWAAAPQAASGSFDGKYTVNVDKVQLETAEKVDGAVIEIEPLEKGGSIDGGSWTITPADKQTVTTGGHTMDDSYQNNGGDAGASWSLHYEVTKTSMTSLSGSEGPFDSQAEADAAAASAKASAEAQLQAEAQGMVDAAIAAAKAQLAVLNFRYDESVVPYGFVLYDGALGSHQDITVSADSSNHYIMRNEEWSLKVNLKKVDSETGEQIAGDALYEVYEWDTVTQQYIPYGGYNQYRVERNPDGTYSVVNDAEYGTEFDTSRTMYYTQRNEGKFVIVETRAPSGYYGDWTDVEHPGTAGTPLGKRGYYIEITAANNSSTITLDNSLYSADIATSYTGGTKLLTSGGGETTVTIYKASEEPAAEVQYQDAGRTYHTDGSGTAANEDSYTMTPQTGVMQNDRTIGEISLSKVDLDAVRYVGGRDTDGDALASGQAHADARLDGAIYDLYAAEDIQHPDGVTGTVDYSKITYPDGTPIWHTTIRDNAGVWHDDYLPVLAKDHLVASAEIKDGWLTFSNLYLGKYYIVERGTGVVIPVEDGAYKLSGSYPDIDAKTKEPTGTTLLLATNGDGQYTDYVYKNQWSYIGQSKALDSSKTYDGYYESYAKGYLVDEHNYYIAPAYSDEGWYIEKTAFEDNRQAEGEQRDTTDYSDNYHIHRDNALAESQDQVMKGSVELSKHVSSTGSSDGIELEGAGFTFYLISDLSKVDQFSTTRGGKYMIQSILDVFSVK